MPKAKLEREYYTLVRHSAFSGKGDETFKHSVEEHRITSPAELTQITKAGGLIFNSYTEARDRAMDENYPPTVQGLVPKVRGTFKGLIYIPAPASAS